MAFNALKYLDDLTSSGFTEEQAKAQLQVLEEIIDSNLATKKDIAEIKRDIKESEQGLKRDIKESEQRLTIKLGGLLLIALIAMSTLSNLGII